ncbi:MAG: hypothetical protein ABIF77_02065 [bacterium]
MVPRRRRSRKTGRRRQAFARLDNRIVFVVVTGPEQFLYFPGRSFVATNPTVISASAADFTRFTTARRSCA